MDAELSVGQASLSEAQVVAWLKRALREGTITGQPARDILVDADGSYINSPFRKQLEPIAHIRIGDWRPDVLCVIDKNGVEQVVAFEVKGRVDHEKGVVQASRYRQGAHESYLCVPRGDDPAPDWLAQMARQTGIGLLRASSTWVDVDVRPAHPLPDPKTLLNTRRYLLGEGNLRTLGLNKPVNYVAAAVLFGYSSRPWQDLTETWGLAESTARMAVRGAETLGLLSNGRLTLKGEAYVDALLALGFDAGRDRPLTRRRLADHAPGYAAVIRAIMLENPVVDFIMRVLIAKGGGPLTAAQLATSARGIDEGMARAVFGDPPLAGQVWQIKSTTRYNLKAAMNDVGLLDSRLARGAGRSTLAGSYDPNNDLWKVRES